MAEEQITLLKIFEEELMLRLQLLDFVRIMSDVMSILLLDQAMVSDNSQHIDWDQLCALL